MKDDHEQGQLIPSLVSHLRTSASSAERNGAKKRSHLSARAFSARRVRRPEAHLGK
jgi:hypothetical protein